jgi:PTH1 family peptidyl-tRNA hydrolase
VRLVVGLGNPGARYERTPHNVGFETVDVLAGRLDCPLRRGWRGDVRYGETAWEGERLLLAQPLTYMNLSGQAVAPLARRKGLKPADVIVVLDDADLPLGQIRVRPSGRAGGHKGLQSVLDHLGTDQVPRVRMGVGRRAEVEDLADHVLARFGEAEWLEAQAMIRRAAEAVLTIVTSGVEEAMNRFNAAPGTRAEPGARRRTEAGRGRDERPTRGADHDQI